MPELKDEIIKSIIIKASEFIESEKLQRLESILSLALYDVQVVKEERALSTAVETPNSEYYKKRHKSIFCEMSHAKRFKLLPRHQTEIFDKLFFNNAT